MATHVQLSIKHDDFIAGRQHIVACVKLQESQEDEIVELICKTVDTSQSLIIITVHHHHHFWPAPLRVRSVTHNQQPPQRAILSHIDCFSQCEIMGLKVI